MPPKYAFSVAAAWGTLRAVVPSDNRFELASARERAEATLAHAFGAGVLDEDELDTRLERLADVASLEGVAALVADLEPVDAPSGALIPAGASQALVPVESQALAVPESLPDHRRVISVLGERKRTGDWLPARHNEVITVVGSTTLDLREARLAPGEIEIRVRGVLSETTLIVPPGMRVDTDDCVTILAEIDHDEEGSGQTPHPTLIRVTGLLILSELEVKVREVGESWWQARKRRKRERRARRRQRR